jgi:hypothetical protein
MVVELIFICSKSLTSPYTAKKALAVHKNNIENKNYYNFPLNGTRGNYEADKYLIKMELNNQIIFP